MEPPISSQPQQEQPPPDARPSARDLEHREEVREALQQAGSPVPVPEKPIKTKHKVWLTTYAVMLVVFAVLAYLLRLDLLAPDSRYLPLLRRLALGGMAVSLILGIARTIDAFGFRRIGNPATRYNLRRIVQLLTGLALFFIALSILSATWYTAMVSLGLISLVLGFALQTPITSFIGWIYVLVRSPYRVGDRIRIGEATGDVIDVGYLDTTLWEVGGDYLSSDHPSGRIIKFPNAMVLNAAVYNYSWPLFPYIWNEVKFQIAYDSDLEFVAQTMQAEAEAQIGAPMMERVKVYRELLGRTPVNRVEVREKPSVSFRVNDNTWLDAIVRYLVEPHEAGRIKNRLTRSLLEKLNAAPDRVLFPKSNAR